LAEGAAFFGWDASDQLHRTGNTGFPSGMLDLQLAERSQQRLSFGERRAIYAKVGERLEILKKRRPNALY
jgi:hypothetical protein